MGHPSQKLPISRRINEDISTLGSFYSINSVLDVVFGTQMCQYPYLAYYYYQEQFQGIILALTPELQGSQKSVRAIPFKYPWRRGREL